MRRAIREGRVRISRCLAQAPLKAAQEVLAAQMKAVMGALGSDAATANKVINEVASLNQARCACALARRSRRELVIAWVGKCSWVWKSWAWKDSHALLVPSPFPPLISLSPSVTSRNTSSPHTATQKHSSGREP